jgi:DnaJ-class molecular chaperone
MPPTNVGHDYYEILGIFHDAQPATVKLAYKRLALARHPDRRKNEPGATADFQLVRFITICYLPFRPLKARAPYY